MHDKIDAWKDTTWQIHPTLDASELDPEVVQFAILESNPIEEYRTTLARGRDKFRDAIENEKDPAQREQLKQAQMTSMWDLLFKATTGDHVYLLVPFRNERDESRGRAFVISSNEPAGRKWLTTKVAYRDGVPTCWCIPVETEIGKSVKVELRKENAIDITKLYDEIVGTI